MASPVWEQIAAGSAVVAVVGTGWAMIAGDGLRHSLNELRATRRSRRAERAAVEATLDDESFDPEAIRGAVSEILLIAEDHWRHWGHHDRSPGRSDAHAIAAWVRVHGLAGAIHLDGEPRVDLLGIVNRESESDNRIEVRVRARLELDVRRHWVDPHTIHIDDRWILGQHAGRWELLDGRGDRFARPALSRPLIPAAWTDDDRLREQALTELARDTTTVNPAGLTDSSAGPRDQLLDLAAIDSRFSPALIDATIRHLLDAWEQETLDHNHRLTPLAAAGACRQLLEANGADPDVRFAIRDIELAGWEPIALDPDRVPPHLTVSVQIHAIRFVTDANDGIIAGTSTISRLMELHWTLELANHPSALWQLADSHTVTGML